MYVLCILMSNYYIILDKSQFLRRRIIKAYIFCNIIILSRDEGVAFYKMAHVNAILYTLVVYVRFDLFRHPVI